MLLLSLDVYCSNFEGIRSHMNSNCKYCKWYCGDFCISKVLWNICDLIYRRV